MRYVHSFLDELYAPTPDGNGFYVLAHSEPDEPRPWVLGALNLMSPLFEDRRTAERMGGLSDQWISRTCELPMDELRRLEDRPSTVDFRPVLGPYGYSWTAFGSSTLRSLTLGFRTQVEGDLCAAVIALSRYRLDHGRYPERLSLLAPKYLPQTPIDLFADQPFRYRPDEARGYFLYSVAEDGVDNGGQEQQGSSDAPFDWIANRQRSQPDTEWVLVSEEQTESDDGTSQGD